MLSVYEGPGKQASNKSGKNHHEERTSNGMTKLCGINTRGKRGNIMIYVRTMMQNWCCCKTRGIQHVYGKQYDRDVIQETRGLSSSEVR